MSPQGKLCWRTSDHWSRGHTGLPGIGNIGSGGTGREQTACHDGLTTDVVGAQAARLQDLLVSLSDIFTEKNCRAEMWQPPCPVPCTGSQGPADAAQSIWASGEGFGAALAAHQPSASVKTFIRNVGYGTSVLGE